MKVSIGVTNWLSKFTQGRTELALDLEEGATAAEAAAAAGIPEGEMGFITVNAVKVDGDYKLTGGDCVRIYPMIIGG